MAESSNPSLYHTLFSAEFFLREPDAPWFQELVVQVIWNEQLLQTPLRLVDGREIEVIFPGIWNVSAGPDFQGAVLRIAGEIRQGPVEVHLRPEAWMQHGHQHDAEYGSVILHVVWDNPRDHTAYPPGIPLLCVADRLTVDIEHLVQNVDLSQYPYGAKVPAGSCANRLAEMSDERVQQMLTAYGLTRLARRARQLATVIAGEGIDTAAYQAVAEGLGYRSNRQPFLELTALAPLEQLAPLSTADREAVLFGLAGLLPDPTREEITPSWRPWVLDRWQRWWPRRTGHKVLSWSRRRQRPQNRAERRLLALCQLLDRTRCRPGAAILQAAEGESARAVLKAIEALLTVPGDEQSRYFSDFHSTLGQPAGLVGDTRVRDLIVNGALPLCLADALLRRDQAARDRIRGWLLALPRLADNRRFEEAAHHFFIPPSRTRNLANTAVTQLGMLELFDLFHAPLTES